LSTREETVIVASVSSRRSTRGAGAGACGAAEADADADADAKGDGDGDGDLHAVRASSIRAGNTGKGAGRAI
jgi:hypothetical protein